MSDTSEVRIPQISWSDYWNSIKEDPAFRDTESGTEASDDDDTETEHPIINIDPASFAFLTFADCTYQDSYQPNVDRM